MAWTVLETDEAQMGDIIAFAGIDDINISETAQMRKSWSITIHLHRRANIVHGILRKQLSIRGSRRWIRYIRHLRDRLFREETNVSMKVEETDSADAFKVSGRGNAFGGDNRNYASWRLWITSR